MSTATVGNTGVTAQAECVGPAGIGVVVSVSVTLNLQFGTLESLLQSAVEAGQIRGSTAFSVEHLATAILPYHKPISISVRESSVGRRRATLSVTNRATVAALLLAQLAADLQVSDALIGNQSLTPSIQTNLYVFQFTYLINSGSSYNSAVTFEQTLATSVIRVQFGGNLYVMSLEEVTTSTTPLPADQESSSSSDDKLGTGTVSVIIVAVLFVIFLLLLCAIFVYQVRGERRTNQEQAEKADAFQSYHENILRQVAEKPSKQWWDNQGAPQDTEFGSSAASHYFTSEQHGDANDPSSPAGVRWGSTPQTDSTREGGKSERAVHFGSSPPGVRYIPNNEDTPEPRDDRGGLTNQHYYPDVTPVWSSPSVLRESWDTTPGTGPSNQTDWKVLVPPPNTKYSALAAMLQKPGSMKGPTHPEFDNIEDDNLEGSKSSRQSSNVEPDEQTDAPIPVPPAPPAPPATQPVPRPPPTATPLSSAVRVSIIEEVVEEDDLYNGETFDPSNEEHVAERKRRTLLLLPLQKQDPGSLKRNPIFVRQHRRNSRESVKIAKPPPVESQTTVDLLFPLRKVSRDLEASKMSDFDVTENLLLTQLDPDAVATADIDSDEEEWDGRGTPPPQVSGPNFFGDS